MSIGPRLELKQSQQLVMTPQLQQAIRLLQMSNLELARFVDDEIERNPLLERLGEEQAAPTGSAAAPAAERPANGPAPGDAWQGVNGRRREADFDFEQRLELPTSLLDHVERQLAMTWAPVEMRAVARAIAGELDDSGYFRGDPAELADRLGVSPQLAEAALALVQTCEPAGIGARDLKECLALQLRERDRYDPAMQAMVENIELLAKADLRRLRQLCGVDEDDLAAMIAEVRALDPRPARAQTGATAVTIAPDVFVRRNNLGAWVVELNTDTLPRVLVNNAYAAEVSRENGEAKQFISECRQNAGWLVKSLEQRARTILKVAQEIVRQQDAFFANGVSGLKPMTLKAVAEAISMHESTVSRVTSGKFMATERGTFEMKYFFSAAVGAANGGEGYSSEAIRKRILAIIGKEDPARPLSDDKIVRLLKAEGIDIARRTVAKYRETLNVPSSGQRRRRNGMGMRADPAANDRRTEDAPRNVDTLGHAQ